jgi:uncharacterized protein (TIGR02284 family)
MDLKATLSSNDRYAILAECERGEDAAIESYRDAMASNLPGSVGVLVDTQYYEIQRVHIRVKELRDAAKTK